MTQLPTGLAIQQRINALTDQIVQLNSGLAYVNSQSTCGSIPILHRRCLYQSHSLLGIGMAVLAIEQFGDFVRRVFDDHPVYDVLRRIAKNVLGFNPGRGVADFDAALQEQGSDIDGLSEGLAKNNQRSHLFFFSGRLGFQESYFAVSAAMQALAASDSIRWSLITLSHELMHSHVRDLLSAICSSKAGHQESEPGEWMNGFLEFQYGHGTPNLKMIDSLRYAILNFCVVRQQQRDSVARMARDDTEIKIREPRLTKEDLQLLFRSYYKEINEIMVSVLDFHYFYQGNIELYVHSLWVSWSTVPSVLVNLDHYIDRTLAAISTMYKSKILERFQVTLAIFQQTISALLERNPTNTLLKYVTQHISIKHNVDNLRLQFLSGAYLAGIVSKHLKSSRIQAAMFDLSDPRATNGDGVFYLLDVEFDDTPVSSIVAFFLERLNRALSREENDDDLAYRSAWLFLAIASNRGV